MLTFPHNSEIILNDNSEKKLSTIHTNFNFIISISSSCKNIIKVCSECSVPFFFIFPFTQKYIKRLSVSESRQSNQKIQRHLLKCETKEHISNSKLDKININNQIRKNIYIF